MNKYGRILFYDTRDGAVVMDTGELQGDISQPDPESYYKILEDKYGSRDNLSHLQLEFGQYANEFNEYSYCRVLEGGKVWFTQKDSTYNLGGKSTRNDRFWPFFEDLYQLYDKDTGTFDEDKIHKFYKDYIDFNLKAACKVATPIWLTIDKISRFDTRNDPYIPLWDNGIFPSLEEFASEILNEGFTFPLHVSNRGDDYKIYDGQHRLIGCQYLASQGKWPDGKKLLSLDMKAISVKHINSASINHELDRSITMHIPTKLLPKYHFINYLSKRGYDDDITEVEVGRYLDVMIIARLYITEMTRILSKYRQISKITLASTFVNDEEAFYEWMKE